MAYGLGLNYVMAMHNSAYSVSANNNAIRSMGSNQAYSGAGLNAAARGAICNNETRLQGQNLNNSLIYKASQLQAETAKELQKENIERTFDTFA